MGSLRKSNELWNILTKGASRLLHTSRATKHENPLGLPRSGASAVPNIPRRGLPQKRDIPNVKKVVVVASGKGGVGKSTIAVNLAVGLALQEDASCRRPRVGLLDLDLFGPSIPKLMGLDNCNEPELTTSSALIPLKNHGILCMSMGFLLPQTKASSTSQPSRDDTAVVWRGLMVQKAIQQLLFDVDWLDNAGRTEIPGPELDVLVIDMPPGTGDVPLTVGQLVNVDGAIIVSTPQDVSLADVRKGIAMFRKVSMPIMGLVLNTSYFLCPSCDVRHYLFGSAESFHRAASDVGVPVMGELPLIPEVSKRGDKGVPFVLSSASTAQGKAEEEYNNTMLNVASGVWKSLSH
ncbi:hypothetical protein EW145_g3973 [Phellinidium pouzarii]|uniref:CobQ/CobB/MinD/ParA nucleotide binding domain-containing protein n=1 Tax=Phellinidium pouzarii TaxID=167371 RepID=A0A4S4L582_9AGAM|nr:hypothetical protein EW145_g3973 [Phellinidium pouzarii]